MFPPTLTRTLIVPLFVFLTASATWLQATPNTISYQGRLTTAAGDPVADSTWQVLLSLHADSSTGVVLWAETASVATLNGLFSHALGSVVTISSTLFSERSALWLQLSVAGNPLLPRTKLQSVPYARASSQLAARDPHDSIVIVTSADNQTIDIKSDKGNLSLRLSGALFGAISLYDSTGKQTITLRGDTTGNNAVVFPDSSISAAEILDEPAIAVNLGVDQIQLPTLSMADLITVRITTPSDGFIVLHGKCYVLLSGTTGPNTALIQIDTDPGGSSDFPWYSQVGLGGYVNTQTCYFPVYVTRAYYADQGTYEFRLEGRANNFPPASAASWDHILTAVFYPTAMDAVAATTANPAGFMNVMQLPVDTLRPASSPTYKIDLREKQERK